jgi:hypothetical protein
VEQAQSGEDRQRRQQQAREPSRITSRELA